jgi:hypothetical protein
VHLPAGDQDARIELWLGQQMDYLPLRLLVIDPTGERLELVLQGVATHNATPLQSPTF